MSANSASSLMTTGSISKRIIAFAIPLFLGNLFQQLYNTADSLIVGNFLGSSALAAVSSSGNLIFLLVGFFNGIAVGAGVVVAKYFGAKNYDLVQKAIHNRCHRSYLRCRPDSHRSYCCPSDISSYGHTCRRTAKFNYLFSNLFLRLAGLCYV